MAWCGRDLEDHLVPISPARGGVSPWWLMYQISSSCTWAFWCWGGSDISPACTANMLEIIAAQADRVSKDPCCHRPHQSLRLISLLPRVYVLPKGKRAARKAKAFADQGLVRSAVIFSLSVSFFLFLWLYHLASLYSGAQWFKVPSLMAIQTSYFRSYTTALQLYLWNGQEGKKKSKVTNQTCL